VVYQKHKRIVSAFIIFLYLDIFSGLYHRKPKHQKKNNYWNIYIVKKVNEAPEIFKRKSQVEFESVCACSKLIKTNKS